MAEKELGKYVYRVTVDTKQVNQQLKKLAQSLTKVTQLTREHSQALKKTMGREGLGGLNRKLNTAINATAELRRQMRDSVRRFVSFERVTGRATKQMREFNTAMKTFQATALRGMLNQLRRVASQQERVVKSSNRLVYWWNRFFKIGLQWAITYRIITNIERAFFALAGTLKEAVMEFDRAREMGIQLAYITRLFTGAPIKVLENLAERQMELATTFSALTGVPIEVLAQGLRVLTQQGIVPLNMSVKEQIKLFKFLNTVWLLTRRTGGKDIKQIITELMTAFEGVQRPGADLVRLFRTLGLEIRELSGTPTEKLRAMINALAPSFDMVIERTKTLSGAYDRATGSLKVFLWEAFKQSGVYDRLVKALNKWAELLITTTGELTPEATRVVKDLALAFKLLYDALETVAEYFKKCIDLAWKLIKPFAKLAELTKEGFAFPSRVSELKEKLRARQEAGLPLTPTQRKFLESSVWWTLNIEELYQQALLQYKQQQKWAERRALIQSQLGKIIGDLSTVLTPGVRTTSEAGRVLGKIVTRIGQFIELLSTSEGVKVAEKELTPKAMESIKNLFSVIKQLGDLKPQEWTGIQRNLRSEIDKLMDLAKQASPAVKGFIEDFVQKLNQELKKISDYILPKVMREEWQKRYRELGVQIEKFRILLGYKPTQADILGYIQSAYQRAMLELQMRGIASADVIQAQTVAIAGELAQQLFRVYRKRPFEIPTPTTPFGKMVIQNLRQLITEQAKADLEKQKQQLQALIETLTTYETRETRAGRIRRLRGRIAGFPAEAFLALGYTKEEIEKRLIQLEKVERLRDLGLDIVRIWEEYQSKLTALGREGRLYQALQDHMQEIMQLRDYWQKIGIDIQELMDYMQLYYTQAGRFIVNVSKVMADQIRDLFVRVLGGQIRSFGRTMLDILRAIRMELAKGIWEMLETSLFAKHGGFAGWLTTGLATLLGFKTGGKTYTPQTKWGKYLFQAPTETPTFHGFTLQKAQVGAILRSPSLVFAGEGEPEAIIPMPGGKVPVEIKGGLPLGQPVNIIIQALDAQSFMEFAERHSDVFVAQVLKSIKHHGAMSRVMGL